jgi:hypothetical protein
MNGAWVPRILLATALLAMLCASSVLGANYHPAPHTGVAPSESPDMGPFLEIWTDGVENCSPAVAYNTLHDEYLVVWHTKQDEYTWDIWARRVGRDGSLGSWFNVDTEEAGKLFEPAVAYSPTHDEYLIVYMYEWDADDYDIYAHRINWDSKGPTGRIYVDAYGDMQQNPSVAYNSQTDEYLVAYEDGREDDGYPQVVGRRVDASDGTVDPSPVTIATAASQWRVTPAVAYNPERNNYLVVYGYQNPSIPRCYIACKTASADLTAFSPEFQIGADVGCGYDPAVGAGPDEYVVVWHTLDEVYGRRVAYDGMPQGEPGGFVLATTSQTMYYLRNPDVSYGAGFGYLAVWEDFDAQYTYAVYGRYVLPGADEPLPGDFVVDGTSPHRQRWPNVACSPGCDCLVVEERNPSAFPSGDYEIRGRFVSPWRSYVPLAVRHY